MIPLVITQDIKILLIHLPIQPWFEKKWKPSLHVSQFTPETPFLHGHNPDLGSHKSDMEPIWLQLHSTHSAVILPKPSCKQFGL